MTSQLGGAAASAHPGGAPLGNQNARKHGLYSQRAASAPPWGAAASAPPWGAAAVESPPGPADLNHDIANLRAYMQRLVDVYADTRVPEEVAFVLRQLTVASLGLTRLVRTQLFANPPEPPRDEVLDEIGSAAE
jgi:hypothetical protein